MWTFFLQKYDECVSKYVPKSKPKKVCKPDHSWRSHEALVHIERKRHAWNKYLAARRIEDFNEYKRVRNLTNEFVKSSKKSYEKKCIQNVKNEPKQFWRYFYTIFTKENFDSLPDVTDKPVNNDLENIVIMKE